MVIYKASMETTKFYFEAYGNTEKEANAILINTLQNHGNQYDLNERWFRHYEVEIHKIIIGAGYRDGEMAYSLRA